MRILVVDDSRIGREATKELLELQGHEVIGEAADDSSALAAASRLHPEAVLFGPAINFTVRRDW